MKAQRIILLTFATVAIAAAATACATKAQLAFHAKLRSSGASFSSDAPANPSRLKGSSESPLAPADHPRSKHSIGATPPPVQAIAAPPVQLTNRVISPVTANTGTNPASSPAIPRAESKPAGAPGPADTLGARITSGEKSVLLWIGIFVLACLFFPAAAPLAGRILAAVVNRTPSLAGLAGVVSVDAFDAIIKAIERTKQSTRLDNDNSTATSPFDELDSNLARELDASHKGLVLARKQTVQRTLQRPDLL